MKEKSTKDRQIEREGGSFIYQRIGGNKNMWKEKMNPMKQNEIELNDKRGWWEHHGEGNRK